MTPLADSYFDAATARLAGARDANRAGLQALGAVIGRSVAAGGVVHTFGSGHSEIIAREIVGRAGGLAGVSAILDVTGGFVENLPGYGTRLAERYDRQYGLRAGETIIVVSHSGKNAAPFEVAGYAKARGLVVVVLTSAALAQANATAHPAGQSLTALADYVLDNGGVTGDAIVPVAAGIRAGPASTLVGALLLNLLFLEVVGWLQANGHPLPILRSQSLPGAIEHNRELAQRYAGRLSRPLA